MIHNAWLMSINAKFNRYINGLSSMREFTYYILSDIMKTHKRISYEFQVTPGPRGWRGKSAFSSSNVKPSHWARVIF